MPRHAEHPAVIPGRRIHGHQQMGRAPRQQPVPERGIVPVPEREAGQEHPVEKALEQGRHGPPPVWIDEHQMLRPADRFLSRDQVRFQGLDGVVALVENGVESQLAQGQETDLVAGGFGALPVGLGQGVAEAGLGGVGEEKEDAGGHRKVISG